MSNEHLITNPAEIVVWGYLAPADFVGPAFFLPCKDKVEAREWVDMSLPGTRKLAKRTLGPVEVVDE